MASPQRIAANRRNARRSTGPRTATGKARAKRNAWQHGLAARLPCTDAVGSDVERLALAIAGPDPDPCRLHFANIAANAQLELRRIHAVRLSLLAARPHGSTASDAEQESPVPAATLLNLPRLDRYERRVLSRRNRALQLL